MSGADGPRCRHLPVQQIAVHRRPARTCSCCRTRRAPAPCTSARPRRPLPSASTIFRAPSYGVAGSPVLPTTRIGAEPGALTSGMVGGAGHGPVGAADHGPRPGSRRTAADAARNSGSFALDVGGGVAGLVVGAVDGDVGRRDVAVLAVLAAPVHRVGQQHQDAAVAVVRLFQALGEVLPEVLRVQRLRDAVGRGGLGQLARADAGDRLAVEVARAAWRCGP